MQRRDQAPAGELAGETGDRPSLVAMDNPDDSRLGTDPSPRPARGAEPKGGPNREDRP